MKRMGFAFGAMLTLASTNLAQAEVPKFAKETKASGINHTYTGGFLYMAGGGVAAFDCNGDDLPELYFAGGEGTAALYLNKSYPGKSLRFEAAGQSPLNLKSVTGAYPLDIDGDGITDLAILRVGKNVLMRGRGNCQFERANESWKFNGGNSWTLGFSATWEKGNTWPTLAFGNFMIPKTIIQDYGDCDANHLYRPAAAGGYQKPIALTPGHCSHSVLFSDWNRDGVPDLRISNDKEFFKPGGAEQLFEVAPGKAPRRFSEADGFGKVSIWGMGIASHDLTGDGYPEYYLTNMVDNRLEILKSGTKKPAFENRAKSFGIAASHPFTGGDKKPSTAWHAEFGDVNNDGLADLLVVKGNVGTVKMVADVDPNNLLIQQPDGIFVEGAIEAGIVDFELGRSGALVDLNQDGALDLVVTNRKRPAELWRNTGVAGNWLRLRLKLTGPNHYGVGRWVEVKSGGKIQRKEITVGGGHAGGQWGWLHFGIGKSPDADVRVQYTNGKWSDWMAIQGNASHTVRP